jgi:CysZ protein
MRSIAHSLLFALAHVLHPKMLWLVLWPVLAALTIWGAVALIFWGQFVFWLADLLLAWIRYGRFLMNWDVADVALIAAKIVTLLALVPLVQLTALLILGAFGMPAMVEYVAARRFVRLERRHGGSLWGSVWNSLLAVAGLAVLALLTLPLWVFPPLWPAIPVAIVGWVNQRVLRYDALAEHADAAEMRSIFRARHAGTYLLGVLLALLAYVPLVGFIAPVLLGLAYIHYLLGELETLRAAPIESEVLA